MIKSFKIFYKFTLRRRNEEQQKELFLNCNV